MEFKGTLSDNIFGLDSKVIFKEWVRKDGTSSHIKVPICVSVNPSDNIRFENDYKSVIDKLFEQFGIEKDRSVYSSSEIGTLLSDEDRYRAFCLAFTREIMNLDYVKFTIFITTFNKKHLTNDKITINGKYGSPTKEIGVEEFIDMIQNSYNVICAWKMMKNLKLKNQMVLIDGTNTVRDCIAWDELKEKQDVRIMFNADKIVPVVSAADIILRNIDFFVKMERSYLNEDILKKIIHYEGKISSKNKYYQYIGNPDIKNIKPNSERIYTNFDLKNYFRKPIIYVYAGVTGQKEIIESSPIMTDVFNYASVCYGSVKIYDPKSDGRMIGADKNNPDYFLPLGEEAEKALSALIATRKNVKRLEL